MNNFNVEETTAAKKLKTLLTPEQMSEKIKNIFTPGELVNLAETGYLPHYNLGGRIFFSNARTAAYIYKNMAIKDSGKPLKPFNIFVFEKTEPENPYYPVPRQLSYIKENLIYLNLKGINTTLSGIYFLCETSANSKNQGCIVVYVGKTTQGFSRTASHCKEKIFTHAYFYPVPEKYLSEVERGFIKALQPKYNISGK